MALSSIEYWKQRALEREASYQAGSEKTIATMQKVYDRAFDNIQKQIDAAKKQLIKKGGNAAEDAEHYLNRLNMLETLQERVYDECKKLENIERNVTARRYTDVMKQGYYNTMFDIQKGVGLAFDFAKLPDKAIQETMLDGWKGRNFSKSIWKNTETIAEMSQEIIKAGFLSGATIQTMTAQLDDVMQSGKFAAERLIRSETNYFANQGELRSYEEAGIEKYQFLATLDNRTSKQCQGLDGKIFYISEAVVAKNYPPMHAFCRSTTVAHFDDKTLEGIERRARDPVTGKTGLVPADMSYKEWQAVYVTKSLTDAQGNAIIELKDINTLQGLSLFAKDKWNVGTVDITGLDAKAVKGTFDAMDKAINENPALSGSIKSIRSKDMNAFMSTNFNGDVYFSNKYYAHGNIEGLKAIYNNDVIMGGSPKGTTWESIGVHELGHLLNAEAIKNNYGVTSAMINDWNNDITAKKIVDKAIRELKGEYDLKGFTRDELLSTIDLNATKKYGGGDVEAIAEAFADYQCNGDDAQLISKKIINVLKGML